MNRPAISAPIGVFDSGIGGLSILRALRSELPAEGFVYLADNAHAPYGERDDPFIMERACLISQALLAQHQIKALVVACNTATAAAIHLLRNNYPDLPIIGVEPALKPAAQLSRSHRVGVMATRSTLASVKFAALHDSLKDQAEFICQPCDGLASAIESADPALIESLCERYLEQMGVLGHTEQGIDLIVLGCTHYPLAQDILHKIIEQTGQTVNLLDSGPPVARQTHKVLEQHGLLNPSLDAGYCSYRATAESPQLQQAIERWLGQEARVKVQAL
ncbi:MAG: hypothetical protein RL468_1067 [Pseudomonadota bacterium]